MAQGQRYDITLHLDNLEQFFAVPEPDPFVPRARFDSGIEAIMQMDILFEEET